MTKQAKILIADDEQAIAAGLGAILEAEGYQVDTVTDGQKALDKLSTESYGVVLADLKMPKLDGLALLKEMQARQIATECIIITGAGTIDSAIDAIRQGADDFIQKPLNAERLNELKARIPKALEKYNLQQKNRELETKLEGLTHYGELTGQSEPMRHVYEVIDKVAPSLASVLILGESGTGKELVARAVHNRSDRAKGPFFALNCAALPKDILENELFGHEKGAFTGSVSEKQGAFEMASGGTIFLDEVAEMSPDIQVKLLRALETRMVRRLGGKKEIQVDIRIVAATNKDLQKAIVDGELREDLYYRLAVVELELPPLRERLGDVQLLANEFLAKFAQANGKKIQGFDDEATEWIVTYHWPGNVRELKNAIEKAVILSRSPIVGIEDMVSRRHRTTGEFAAPLTMPMGSTLAETRRQMILKTFASHAGDHERTAKTLGVSVAEVRAELMAMMERRTVDAGAEPVPEPTPEPTREPVAEAPPVPAAPAPDSRAAVRLPAGAAPVVGKAGKTPVAAASGKGKKGQ